MKIVQEDFRISTKSRSQMIDITSQVGSLVNQSGVTNGDVIVYCPHTTAAITINENADPSVPHDMLLTLEQLLPQHRSGYRHSEGNSDSHCKSSLIGCSEQILLKGGSLQLGTWQGIFFCEFDGPRSRKVIVQIRGE
ncbi:MAG: secondary thiamine-phosphate synthase enzyme YjbQ [Planctomycetota bacterium]|jgi:secondary thiamine-phosphate synthase enzyme